MNKKIIACTAFLLVFISLAFGADNRYKGKPKFKAGQPARFVIWEENGVFKLRTTTTLKLRIFKGAVHAAGGTFDDVRLVSRDAGDYLRLSKNKKTIFFRFSTWTGIDGFNFKTDAKRIAFSLKIDNVLAKPVLNIFLGKDYKHPLHNPFFLFLTEDEKKDKPENIDFENEEGSGDVTEAISKEMLEPESMERDK